MDPALVRYASMCTPRDTSYGLQTTSRNGVLRRREEGDKGGKWELKANGH